MSRKCEQRLWDRLRRNLAARLLIVRVENIVAVGFPDAIAQSPKAKHVKCTTPKRTSMLEFKAVEEPPKRFLTPLLGDKHGLSQEQKNFAKDWIENSGTIYFLIGVGTRQFLLPGHLHDAINAMNFADVERNAIATQWDGIFEELTK